MTLYEVLVESKVNVERMIWCTDGSFIRPKNFKKSGKEAYGYALDGTTVARLTRSACTVWAPSNSPFYTTNLTRATSTTDGVANSDILRSFSGFSSSACPAIYYGCTQVNAGVTSYMPARDEVDSLRSSIMSGNMKKDLITAGLYESCNYRRAYNNSMTNSGDWYDIWSSTQYSDLNYFAWDVYYDGSKDFDSKYYALCVIPFFKV